MRTKEIHDRMQALCQLIEKLPASGEQTDAAVAASRLLLDIQKDLAPGDGETRGEQLVRIKFNPSDDSTVAQLKEDFARLINNVAALETNIKREDRYRPALTYEQMQQALNHLETAAMYAVKVATAGK